MQPQTDPLSPNGGVKPDARQLASFKSNVVHYPPLLLLAFVFSVQSSDNTRLPGAKGGKAPWRTGDKSISPALGTPRNKILSIASLSQHVSWQPRHARVPDDIKSRAQSLEADQRSRNSPDSQLLDRVSALEAEKAALQAQSETTGTSSANTSKGSPAPQAPSPAPSAPPAQDTPTVARLRLELAEALRAKGQFQHRLQAAEEELIRLRTKAAADSKALRGLTSDKRILTIKLRDREEELRVKNKLVADVQDELAVLNMQLDMVEKRRAEQEAENKQLVERFMRRVGQEAEAMNLANEPLFSKKR